MDNDAFDPKLELSSYHYPTLDLLTVPASQLALTPEILSANQQKIVDTLAFNDIKIEKIKATIGPTLTLYEFIPGPGSRVAKIRALEADLSLYLAAQVRVVGPFPGKGTMGVEIPHEKAEVVAMRSILATEKFQTANMELPVPLGKTMDNAVYLVDLASLPHLLIAGATGQGKSVFLNSLIVSLLYKKHPSELKLVLIDTSKLELSPFRKVAYHFLAMLPNQADPVISKVTQAVDTFNALCIELDQRYELLKIAGARNVQAYNQKFIDRHLNPADGHRYLPYIVTVIDEFAELLVAEAPVTRLAQLGRPAGFHLVIATQRPTVKVITGGIKANFSSRLAFRVVSPIDSRAILDAGGAEHLNGQGDMLLATGTEFVRLQGALIDTAEIERVCDFISVQRGYPSPMYLPEFNNEPYSQPLVADPDDLDPLFEDCARLIVLHQQGSTSLIQRKFKLGYNRAGRIIDQLEAAGVVGPFEGSKARDVLFPDEYLLEKFLQGEWPETASKPVAPTPIIAAPLNEFPPGIIPEPEAKPQGLWSKLFNKNASG